MLLLPDVDVRVGLLEEGPGVLPLDGDVEARMDWVELLAVVGVGLKLEVLAILIVRGEEPVLEPDTAVFKIDRVVLELNTVVFTLDGVELGLDSEVFVVIWL